MKLSIGIPLLFIGVAWIDPSPAAGQILFASLTEAQKALEYAVNLDLQGRDEQARVNYLRAIQLNPHNVRAYDRFSRFLFARGKSREGVEMLRRGLNKNPQMLELRALLGMHLYRLGKIREAYRELQAGVQKLTRHDVQAVHARCAFLLEKYPVAASILRKYLAARPSEHAARDHAFKTQLALALMRVGSVKEAQRLLNAIISRRPKYRRAREAQAELLLHMGRCKQAVRAYKALKTQARSSLHTLKMGSAYLCLGRYRDALALADRYLDRRQPYIARLTRRPAGSRRYQRKVRRIIEGLLIRGDAETKLGRYERALAAFKTVELLSGRSEKMALRVARSLFMMKRYDGVLKRLEGELKRPHVTPAIVIIALRAAVRAKQIPTVLRCAARLSAGKASPTLRYYAGMAYNSAGRFERAVEQLERVLAASPGHRPARRELVRAYGYQGKRELGKGAALVAIKLLGRAERLAPRRSSIQRNMVVALLATNRSRRAVVHAKRLLRLRPDDPISHRLMARSRAQAGQHAEALVSYRAARKAAAKDPLLRVRLLTEEAVSLVKTGRAAEGILRLRRARRLGAPLKDERLISSIDQLLTHAVILHASGLLEKGKAREVQRVLAGVSKRSRELSPQRRAVVTTLIILAKIVSGRVRPARRLVKKHRAELGKSLRPEFNKVGVALLFAIADGSARASVVRARAAAKLEQLAARVPKSARDQLRTYAGIIYHQLGVRAFRRKRRAKAKAAFARSQRLLPALSPSFRHNKAVVDYYTGSKDGAIRALFNATRLTPLAYCNLAVHYGQSGDKKRAHDLFKQCNKRGVRTFPNLKQILELRQQLGGDQTGI